MTWKWLTNFVDSVKTFSRISPAFLDGSTYVLLGITGFLLVYLGTDEAAKYVAPGTLFWLICVIGAMNAGLLALKMFRNTGYAKHVADQKQKDETVIFAKQKENG